MQRPSKQVLRSSICAFAVIMCLLASGNAAGAQAVSDVRSRMVVPDSAHLQIVTLTDGSTIFGRIVTVGADSVSFQTGAGTMQLSVKAIRDVRLISNDDVREGDYWFPNPNSTRLFFAPTGQQLKQGEGYFSDYELFFPGVAVGVTDNISIGGGISLIPASASDQIYYVTPKIGFSPSDQVHLAAGVLFAGTNGGTGGIYYGVGTFGDGNGSVTIGGGYGFAGGKIQSKPVGMLGASSGSHGASLSSPRTICCRSRKTTCSIRSDSASWAKSSRRTSRWRMYPAARSSAFHTSISCSVSSRAAEFRRVL